MYCILSSTAAIFYIENDAEIFPVHYTWKVAEKEFMMAFMMNKLSMINSCKITLKKLKLNIFFQKSLWNLGAHYTCMCIILKKYNNWETQHIKDT